MNRGVRRKDIRINVALLQEVARAKDEGSKYETEEAQNEENTDIEYQTVDYQDSKTHKAWDGRAPPMPDFPNQNRFAPKPYRPTHYDRGAKTKQIVSRIFKYQGRGRDKPLLGLDRESEDRIWIDQARRSSRRLRVYSSIFDLPGQV